jgi:hypothetical protein
MIHVTMNAVDRDSNSQAAGRALLAGTRRNGDVVTGIRRHRLANIRIRREERAECRMFLSIGVIIDQRGFIRELFCDVRMLAGEVIPELEFMGVDIASISPRRFRSSAPSMSR